MYKFAFEVNQSEPFTLSRRIRLYIWLTRLRTPWGCIALVFLGFWGWFVHFLQKFLASRKTVISFIMAFTGTLDKCKACDKTVYVVDSLSLEGNPYHKHCFKCSHCKGTLSMSSYSWMDGVLYCKTHFEQLFKESGNFSKNFQSAKTPEKQSDLTRAPSKLSSMFSGTQDRCAVCTKIVYPLEKVNLEGECYHKNCFRCAHGGCHLTHCSYAALDGVLYCKHHFSQLFMVKGNYNHVLEAAANKKTVSPPAEPAEEDGGSPQPQPEEHAVEHS